MPTHQTLPQVQQVQDNYDFEVRSLDKNVTVSAAQTFLWHLKFAVAGILFGILLVKSEVISWFRIQEMFHLQSFHMYGVIGSAVLTGMLSILIIKKFNIKTISGESIVLPQKKFNKGQVYGGFLFGFGWALTGACPGPLFALLGTGASVISVTLISAIAGTWIYGYFKNSLPH